MTPREILRTALRSLRINPLRAALSVLGVIFGISCVIALIAMGEGVRDQIVKEIKELGTNLLVIRSGEPISETEGISASQLQMLSQPSLGSSTITVKDLATVRESSFVEDAYPMIRMAYEIKAAEGEERKTHAFIKGTDGHYTSMNKTTVAYGRFLGEGGGGSGEDTPRECVLGTVVSKALFGAADQSVLGKKVRLGYVDPGTGSGTEMEFKVVGIMEERRSTVVNNPNLEMYIPLRDAQVLGGGLENVIMEIYANVKSEDYIQAAKEELQESIRRNHEGKLDFNIQTQDDLMGTYDYIFDVLTALVIGVASISLIEGGVGVANIMYVSVKERTKEIGVRLAQGASKRMIILQFLLESVLLSLLGAIIGIPLGIMACLLINLSVLPAKPTLWGVAVAFVAAFVVGVVAGVFPARQATKVEITEALRAEF